MESIDRDVFLGTKLYCTLDVRSLPAVNNRKEKISGVGGNDEIRKREAETKK